MAARSLADLEQAYLSGTNPLAYIPLAEELRKRRHLERALAVCREGLEARGPSGRARALLGKILLEMRRYGEAVEALRAAVDLAPGSYEPTLLLAKALTQRCDYLEAREVLAPLAATYPRDHDIQQLQRIIRSELHESGPAASHEAGDGASAAAEGAGGGATAATSSLRQDLEDTEGVDAIFEFGVREARGDIFFEEAEGQELDEDIKVTVIEGARLATKLNFGKPRQFIIEAPSGKIFLRIEGEKGLMALTSSNVKLGRLRYMMDQCLRAGAG